MNCNMMVVNLFSSTAQFLYINTAAGDLLQVRNHIDGQDDWPDEDDLLAADMRKFNYLRPPPNKIQKERHLCSGRVLNATIGVKEHP